MSKSETYKNERENLFQGPRKNNNKYMSGLYSMQSPNSEFFGLIPIRNTLTDECFSNFIGFNRKRGALGYRTFSSDLHFHTNVSRGSLVGRTRARTHQSSSRSLLSKRSESSQILWPRLPTQAKPTRDKGGLRASIAASCCAARHMDIYGTAHPPAISTVPSRPREDSGNATH